MEIAHGSLAELSRALADRKVSAVELAQAHLGRIESHRNLNAFLDVRPEVTLAQAAAADARLAHGGDATPLTGVPIAHKDIFVTKDFFSTASSKILRGYRSPFDATVVDNLTQAGMVTVGKTNCDEFAMGSSNENSAFGNVLNPVGSRGGSGRLVRRLIGRGGRATGAGRNGHRYRRFDPRARGVYRRHGHQADLRPAVALGNDCLCVEPGYRRADDALGRGRSPGVQPDAGL